MRGQIPAAVLKSITHMRIRTTPKGGYEPMFKICCGGVVFESKDNCPTEFADKQSVIEIACPEIPVIDEVFVVFFRPGTFGKKKKMLQFWFHTSFVENNKLVVKKKDMDKAIKDKKHKKYSAVCYRALSLPPLSVVVDRACLFVCRQYLFLLSLLPSFHTHATQNNNNNIFFLGFCYRVRFQGHAQRPGS
jgi:hypothetical protein